MAPALFLFATEDGTILGWNPGVTPLPSVLSRAKRLHHEPICHGDALRPPRGPHRQSVTLQWNILPMDRFTLVRVKSDDAIDFDPNAVSGSLATAVRGAT
jgi:hypothetical protein